MHLCSTLGVCFRFPSTFVAATNDIPGWGKKMSYCIAFSVDGCSDVTRRYVRNPSQHAMPRNKCAEGVLAHIIGEIKALRRRDMDKTERFRLVKEDMQEEEYLRSLIIEAIAYSVSKIVPGTNGGSVKSDRPARPDADAQKAAEQQQERARARNVRRGNQSNQPPQHRDQRQQ